MNIGLGSNAREQVASALAKLLADTYYLYLKTQNYHWNVTGPNFHMLHDMFEKQYQDLAEAVDELAERIRALGHEAPGSYVQFSELASIEEASAAPDHDTMINDLLNDHELLIRHLRQGIVTAQNAGDEGSADILVGRLKDHEKTAWMLRASTAS